MLTGLHFLHVDDEVMNYCTCYVQRGPALSRCLDLCQYFLFSAHLYHFLCRFSETIARRVILSYFRIRWFLLGLCLLSMIHYTYTSGQSIIAAFSRIVFLTLSIPSFCPRHVHTPFCCVSCLTSCCQRHTSTSFYFLSGLLACSIIPSL